MEVFVLWVSKDISLWHFVMTFRLWTKRTNDLRLNLEIKSSRFFVYLSRIPSMNFLANQQKSTLRQLQINDREIQIFVSAWCLSVELFPAFPVICLHLDLLRTCSNIDSNSSLPSLSERPKLCNQVLVGYVSKPAHSWRRRSLLPRTFGKGPFRIVTSEYNPVNIHFIGYESKYRQDRLKEDLHWRLFNGDTPFGSNSLPYCQNFFSLQLYPLAKNGLCISLTCRRLVQIVCELHIVRRS